MKQYLLILLSVLIVACGPATKQKRIQKTFELANKKLEEGYFDDAVSLYSQVISKDPEITDAFMNRGVAYYESGHYALALSDYNHVYFNYPEYPEVLFNRTYCNLELQRFSALKEDISELKRLYPDSSLVSVIDGLYWEAQKNYPMALESFSQAIAKDTMNFDAWSNRGIMNYHLEKYKAAESDLLTALTIDQNAPNALNPLSLVYANSGQLDKADSTIDMALKILPNQPYFLNNKGYIQILKGELKKADSLLLKSESLDNQNAWLYKNRGLLELKRGDMQAAKIALEKAMTLDSTIVEVREMLAEI